MEILISMKGVNEGKYVYQNPYMNDAFFQSNGYFIAEIREADRDKIKILHRYGIILLRKLRGKGNYSIEETSYGFKLMRKVKEDKDYIEDWDEWAAFSELLHSELEKFFKEEEIKK